MRSACAFPRMALHVKLKQYYSQDLGGDCAQTSEKTQLAKGPDSDAFCVLLLSRIKVDAIY